MKNTQTKLAIGPIGLFSRWACVLLAAGACSGCVGWSYDRIQLGETVSDSQRLLPVDKTRRTDVGFCFYDQDWLGRTDAVVVLVSRNQQIWGKLHATHARQNYGFASNEEYVLRGVLDPVAAQLNATGPVDTLRAVINDLVREMDDDFVREGHGWVAVGLSRLVQRWPHMGIEPGGGDPDLMEMLARVPSGGAATMRVTPDGYYELEYRP